MLDYIFGFISGMILMIILIRIRDRYDEYWYDTHVIDIEPDDEMIEMVNEIMRKRNKGD